MIRTAFVDDKLYSREFTSGDVVRKSNLRDYIITPYVGRVLYSNTDTGVVMVQWPWGATAEPPTELIHVGSTDFLPPMNFDSSYSTWEKATYSTSKEIVKSDEKWRKGLASSIVKEYEESTGVIYRAACKEFHDQTPEIKAITRLSAKFASEFGFDTVRRTVGNLYGLGRRVAIYWKNSQRQYQVSQSERASGRLSCPRCAGKLASRRYRANRDIMQCRTCGFSIHSRDLRRK